VPIGLGAQWMITLYGKNLTDQHQKLAGIDFSGLGAMANAWGRGRVLGVNVAAKF
jgi:outer membrane receptor protein involved in Fe transport